MERTWISGRVREHNDPRAARLVADVPSVSKEVPGKRNGPSHDDAGGAVGDTTVALLGGSSQTRKPATSNALAEGTGKEEERGARHGTHYTCRDRGVK